MEMNTKLEVINTRATGGLRNTMKVMPDCDDDDLVAFTISLNNKNIPLSKIELDEGSGCEEYFHLTKVQTGMMIDYLKRLYDNME